MAQPTATDVIYPESDGQPVGETDIHRDLLLELVDELKRFFRERQDVQDVQDVYVTGNLFFYYVKGQPRFVVCPDVCVVFGAVQQRRDTYRTWRDGPFPQVVMELTSSNTRKEDYGPKRELYERLGVMEYYLFDPHFDPGDSDAREGDVVGELRYCHRPEPSAPFDAMALLPPDGVLHSPLLGLGLTVRGQALRLLDEATQRLLPTRAEDVEQARQAEDAARQAEDAARQAELARQEEAAARHAAERRAQELADEVARLRAQIDQRDAQHE